MKGAALEVVICGKRIRLGDFVKVEYTTGTWSKGGRIEGKIVELWAVGQPHLQARVEKGWCFHDCDVILKHEPTPEKEEA